MAQEILTKNNAVSTLLAGITSGALSVSCQAGHGARFDSPGAGQIAKLTLYNSAGLREIVHVTARSGDTLTIVRAQEGTTALAWNAGDGMEQTATAAFLNGLSQLDRTETYTAPKTFAAPTTNSAIVKFSKGADVVSAAALTLGTDGNYFDVTGAVTITSIATAGVGTVVKLHFDAALTLTHHATDLILPGGANIVTAAGDEAEFVEYAAGDWRCTNYSNNKSAAGGYARVSPNMYRRTDATVGETSLVRDTLTLVTGPLGITGLILRLNLGIYATGTAQGRSSNVTVYSDSGGATIIDSVALGTYEQVAGITPGLIIAQEYYEIHVKADSSNRVWVKLADDTANQGFAYYNIIGYYD